MDDFYRSLGVVNDASDSALKQKQLEAQQQFELQKQAKEHELKQTGAKQNLGMALEAIKSGQIPEGAGITLGADSASVTRQPTLGMYDLKKEQMDRRGQADYSKRLEKTTGFSSALQDIEGLTNRSGKGGILTNPEEKLQSAGAIKSAVPTSMLGIGEAVGLVPKGSAEERKALERLQLEYQKSMTGARTSEDMSRREKQAMGWITSGDPDLVAKGVRALAHNVKRATQTIQAGYSPDVQERVHEQMGNPMDFLNQVPDEKALPRMPGKQTYPVSAPMPSNPNPSSEEQEYLMLRKKHKGF